jgi:hypothetical protein
MLDNSPTKLSRAALHTLAYADIFDYPLTALEIHRYLTGVRAPVEVVNRALEEDRLFVRIGDYFTLPGREEIVSIRIQREARSRKLMRRAIQYGRILGALPYIRMVALTGSLAVLNVSNVVDFDYMLVTARGRLWTARAFALAFNRLTRLQGYTLCPNLIISENALEWPLHDLYSARELCQMIPIVGLDVYSRLMQANQWVFSFLPNAFMESNSLLLKNLQEQAPALQSLFEFPLRGNTGDRLETWEMNRKIARFARQYGYGEETIFNADVCQGNFDHHRSWTYEALEKRLQQYVIASDGQVAAERHTGVETERSNPPLKAGIASPLGFDTAPSGNHRLLNQRGSQ